MAEHLPIQAVERVSPDAVDITGQPLSPPNLPKDYIERFHALTLKTDFQDTIFAHIANGGTLISLAEVWGVRHSDIAGYIAEHPKLKERYEFALTARGEWEKERMLQELRAIATVDIRDAYDDNCNLKNVRDMSPTLAAALQSIETDELFAGHGDEREQIGVTRKVKFWDKAKAIELFMKKHGLLIERKEVKVTRTLEDIVGAANEEVIEAEVVTQKNATEKAEATPGAGEMKSENHSL